MRASALSGEFCTVQVLEGPKNLSTLNKISIKTRCPHFRGLEYSRTSLIQPSNLRAPPSTGHYLWPHKINFLSLVSCACWSGASDLCKLSIHHTTAVFTQSAPNGFTLASFPGLPRLQFLIACSTKTEGEGLVNLTT